ncbi:hypothetical protein F4774DRAFT_32088 [Daldinia eschscholtzii]|nr:hypothetical protein F4774DRAFT_32088 [Daldinia eschscholtzii]
MENNNNGAIKRRAQDLPQYTLNPLSTSMGFVNPIPALPRSRHPEGKWPGPTYLLPNTLRQAEEGGKCLGTENFKGDTPNSTKTEIAADPNNYSSTRSSVKVNCHDARPLSRHHANASSLRVTDWRTFPPEAVLRFDLTNSTILPEEKFLDIERVTNEYIAQSTAFREWVDQKTQELYSLSSMEQRHEEIEGGVSTTDAFENAEKRKATIHEIQETYAAFVDIETIGADVSVRRQASEALQRQRRLPLSETKRLLGSDGLSSCYSGLLKEKHLYLTGFPPKVVRLPFEKAVDAGLEDIHAPGGYAFSSLPPDTLQTQPPPPRVSASEPHFLFEPTVSQRRTLHIPEWFEHFEMPLKGRNREARWNDLTNRIYTLETKIRHRNDDEESGKALWDKKWHEPDKRWSFAYRRQHGGWWKCRSGPDAPAAEAKCRLCHGKTTDNLGQTSTRRSAVEKLAELQNAIDKAMTVVGEKDKAIALEKLRQANAFSDGGKMY